MHQVRSYMGKYLANWTKAIRLSSLLLTLGVLKKLLIKKMIQMHLTIVVMIHFTEKKRKYFTPCISLLRSKMVIYPLVSMSFHFRFNYQNSCSRVLFTEVMGLLLDISEFITSLKQRLWMILQMIKNFFQ